METRILHTSAEQVKPAKSLRLASIDALRGFDMLMISGGGAFIFLLGGKTGVPLIDAAAAQFEHPEWNGFTFYDFIFPLFLFLAGTSLTFSIQKVWQRECNSLKSEIRSL
ncbi:DUF5009 domain-containing protein [Dyadobacter crusticola]|uniref:DUF5009 domain-containing protein n=1 Tax=Dyadobacter crusticola TaxID=292407 RepID=UPI001E659DB7|nr:DUF5009 domain-containing protein [Dyadobacter crusticola]